MLHRNALSNALPFKVVGNQFVLGSRKTFILILYLHIFIIVFPKEIRGMYEEGSHRDGSNQDHSQRRALGVAHLPRFGGLTAGALCPALFPPLLLGYQQDGRESGRRLSSSQLFLE